MQDPTAANREAIGNFVTNILPGGSPLKQSIEADKAEAKALELEAKAEQERVKAAEQRAKEEASLMSQGAPAKVPQTELTREPSAISAPETLQAQAPSLTERGLAQEVAAESKLGQQNQTALQDAQAQIVASEEKAAIERQNVKNQIDAQMKEIEGIKIEPKSFYEGKSTGERIAAGIGHFFAALTPQGAANAQKIIQNEIDRDLDAQRSNLGKKQNTLGMLQQKLGSVDAAETAFRLKALQNVEMKIKSQSEGAKGQFAQAKANQALGQLGREKEKLAQELALKMADRQLKNMGKMIDVNGYVGMAPTEGEAAKFREYTSEANTAKTGIAELLMLAKKGSSLSPEDRARAKTIATMVKGALRTTLVGSGTVSESDQKILDDVVANPLEVTRLSSMAQSSLGTLAKRIDTTVGEKAKSLGLGRAEGQFDKFKRK